MQQRDDFARFDPAVLDNHHAVHLQRRFFNWFTHARILPAARRWRESGFLGPVRRGMIGAMDDKILHQPKPSAIEYAGVVFVAALLVAMVLDQIWDSGALWEFAL